MIMDGNDFTMDLFKKLRSEHTSFSQMDHVYTNYIKLPKEKGVDRTLGYFATLEQEKKDKEEAERIAAEEKMLKKAKSVPNMNSNTSPDQLKKAKSFTK